MAGRGEKKFWDHLVRHVIGDLAVVGTVAAIAFAGIYFGGFAAFGINSYNGLTPEHTRRVYQEFLRRYTVLSKVGGVSPLGYFERGIVTGQPGSAGLPLYFHYLDNGKGNVTFQIYLLPGWETWTTDPGIFGIGKVFTGSPLYP